MLDINLFKNPPREYGELPFWGWNDELEIDELRRQIALIDDEEVNKGRELKLDNWH